MIYAKRVVPGLNRFYRDRLYPKFLGYANLLIKTDSTVICMLEHICYEPFSLKKLNIWQISYVNRLNFVYCLKFESLRPH